MQIKSKSKATQQKSYSITTNAKKNRQFIDSIEPVYVHEIVVQSMDKLKKLTCDCIEGYFVVATLESSIALVTKLVFNA